MRFAIIYSGQLRTWNRCKENHRTQLWDRHCALHFHTTEKPEDFGRPFSYYPSDEVFFEPMLDHEFNKNKRPETTIHSSWNQWMINYNAFQAVPKDYDVYVRCRTDIEFDEPFYLRNYEPKDFEGKKIYIPRDCDYGGVNDQFAFGGYEVMKAYYDVWHTHQQLFEDGVEFHSEGMQKANLEKAGAEIIRLKTFAVIRR